MNREFQFQDTLAESAEAFTASGDGCTGASGSADDFEGIVHEGVVKWFRSDKGYGFVALSGGAEDAFLHLKALRAFGRESAAPGAKIKAVVERGARGMQVTRVLAIEESSASHLYFGVRSGRRDVRDLSSAVDLTGRVKWFDDVRGFGFVASDDFGRDVFVHCTVLDAAGLARLDQGQVVSMRVIETPKGREAVHVSL
jgi:CspA family cold shock protein